MSKPKILVVVGTTREGRSGRKVADWYMAEAQKIDSGLDLELLDLKDLDLPLFNEPMSPMWGKYSDVQKSLASKVAAADGFVFVTAEYNHSVSASLKNFIDYLSAEWNHKAAAYVGYGAAGASRAIEHMVQIMTELRVVSTKDHIAINAIWEALDEKGQPKEGYVHGDIAAQLTELSWWSDALKAARK